MNKADADKEQLHIKVFCSHCEARVSAKVVGQHVTTEDDEGFMFPMPTDLFVLAVCPHDHVLLARHECLGEDDYGRSKWTDPVRVWPLPDKEANALIPDIVRVSLEDANKCHRAGVYTACAVMCGRALEGLGVHYGMEGKGLHYQLRELLKRGLIDERLWKWADALRMSRNTAAHATGEKISKQDATDLLDFLNAICEYVFVLTPKFEAFIARKPAAGSRKGGKSSIEGKVDGKGPPTVAKP